MALTQSGLVVRAYVPYAIQPAHNQIWYIHVTLFDMTLVVRSHGTYIERLGVHYLEHSSINSHGFSVLRVFSYFGKLFGHRARRLLARNRYTQSRLTLRMKEKMSTYDICRIASKCVFSLVRCAYTHCTGILGSQKQSTIGYCIAPEVKFHKSQLPQHCIMGKVGEQGPNMCM